MERRYQKYALALLDKSFPPMHSFVDGMLCEAYPRETQSQIVLLVERNHAYPKVTRYKGSICLNVLPRRRGLGRLMGPFASYIYSRQLLRRLRSRGSEVSIFVRNDPMFLLGVLPLKRKVTGVVFQSSFPHEVSTGISIKQTLARLIMKLGLRRTDALLAVSEGGAKRISAYAPGKPVGVIPLAVDTQVLRVNKRDEQDADKLKVLYLGTHDPARELEVVFAGCEQAVSRGIPMEIVSVGGTRQHIEQLMEDPSVKGLVEKRILQFKPSVPRTEVFQFLETADVGLSLIPPNETYRESSPTKLAEYMGSGVLCVASNGIPAQEDLIKRSGAGVLADFQPLSIAQALEKIWLERDKMSEIQRRGRDYINKNFTYINYVDVLDEMLWGHE